MSAKRMVPLVLAALLLTGCGGLETAGSENIYTPQRQTGASAANYTTLTLAPGDISKDSELSLTPGYDVTLEIRTQEDLVFAEYLVGRGESVSQGQALARLESEASQADVLASELALERAQERQARTMEALETVLEETKDRTDLSGEALELQIALAELAIQEQQAQDARELVRLRQALEDARARLEDVYYYAPFDGVVSTLTSYSAGSRLDSGSALLTLHKADSLILVGTSNTDNFQFGMTVTVEYGKANRRKTVQGRVVATDRVLGDYFPQSGSIYIKLDDHTLTADDLENPLARVHTIQLKDQMIVPKSAVQTENGEYYVNILEGDTVQKRYILRGVTVGSVGDFQVQVLAGLQYGQLLVLN